MVQDPEVPPKTGEIPKYTDITGIYENSPNSNTKFFILSTNEVVGSSIVSLIPETRLAHFTDDSLHELGIGYLADNLTHTTEFLAEYLTTHTEQTNSTVILYYYNSDDPEPLDPNAIKKLQKAIPHSNIYILGKKHDLETLTKSTTETITSFLGENEPDASGTREIEGIDPKCLVEISSEIDTEDDLAIHVADIISKKLVDPVSTQLIEHQTPEERKAFVEQILRRVSVIEQFADKGALDTRPYSLAIPDEDDLKSQSTEALLKLKTILSTITLLNELKVHSNRRFPAYGATPDDSFTQGLNYIAKKLPLFKISVDVMNNKGENKYTKYGTTPYPTFIGRLTEISNALSVDYNYYKEVLLNNKGKSEEYFADVFFAKNKTSKEKLIAEILKLHQKSQGGIELTWTVKDIDNFFTNPGKFKGLLHDLRTPITPVPTSWQLLLKAFESRGPEFVRSRIELINNKLEELGLIIGSFIRTPEQEKDIIKVLPLINQAKSTIVSTLKEHLGIENSTTTVEVDNETLDKLSVFFPEGLALRIFSNLSQNAEKAFNSLEIVLNQFNDLSESDIRSILASELHEATEPRIRIFGLLKNQGLPSLTWEEFISMCKNKTMLDLTEAQKKMIEEVLQIKEEVLTDEEFNKLITSNLSNEEKQSIINKMKEVRQNDRDFVPKDIEDFDEKFSLYNTATGARLHAVEVIKSFIDRNMSLDYSKYIKNFEFRVYISKELNTINFEFKDNAIGWLKDFIASNDILPVLLKGIKGYAATTTDTNAHGYTNALVEARNYRVKILASKNPIGNGAVTTVTFPIEPEEDKNE